MIRNINKRNKHTILGESYSWPALLAIVHKALTEQGYTFVTGAMSMAIVIRTLDNIYILDEERSLFDGKEWSLKQQGHVV